MQISNPNPNNTIKLTKNMKSNEATEREGCVNKSINVCGPS